MDCLQLVKEEDDAGTLDLESPDDEAKTEKINKRSATRAALPPTLIYVKAALCYAHLKF